MEGDKQAEQAQAPEIVIPQHEEPKVKNPDTLSQEKQIQLLAETYVAENGSKAVSKAISRGHIDTGILQAIAKYAERDGIKLKLKDILGKSLAVTPMLRSLNTIQRDLSYSNDLLFYTAVQKNLISTVEYLLIQGVSPLCRNGSCMIEAMMNKSMLLLFLDYLPNQAENPAIPAQVIEAAIANRDNMLVRLLLMKGCRLSSVVLDAWYREDKQEWLLMRVYIRYQPTAVLQYHKAKVLKDSMNVSDSDSAEEKREVFSLFVSKVGAEILQYVSQKDTNDEFIKFMIRDLSQGRYEGQVGSSSKKRKVDE